jgi:hypothetical protein
MGDIESYLKHKFDLEAESQLDRNQSSIAPPTFYLRDPSITDEQNLLLHRPYTGNPFIAPGTIGSKTRRSFQSDSQASGFKDDESFYFNNDESHMIAPQHTSPLSAQPQQE